jgi:hypothetical protein
MKRSGGSFARISTAFSATPTIWPQPNAAEETARGEFTCGETPGPVSRPRCRTYRWASSRLRKQLGVARGARNTTDRITKNFTSAHHVRLGARWLLVPANHDAPLRRHAGRAHAAHGDGLDEATSMPRSLSGDGAVHTRELQAARPRDRIGAIVPPRRLAGSSLPRTARLGEFRRQPLPLAQTAPRSRASSGSRRVGCVRWAEREDARQSRGQEDRCRNTTRLGGSWAYVRRTAHTPISSRTSRERRSKSAAGVRPGGFAGAIWLMLLPLEITLAIA